MELVVISMAASFLGHCKDFKQSNYLSAKIYAWSILTILNELIGHPYVTQFYRLLSYMLCVFALETGKLMDLNFRQNCMKPF